MDDKQPSKALSGPVRLPGSPRGFSFGGVGRKIRDREFVASIAPLLGLIVLVVFFSAFNARFLSVQNLISIVRQSAIPWVLMIGETIVILEGGMDLSIEGNMALTGIIVSLLVANDANHNNFGFWAIPVGMVVGLLMGLLNGFIHVKGRIPSFMVTLGTWFIGLGLGVLISKGNTFPIRDHGFISLYAGRLSGIPNVTIIALVLVAIGWVLLRYTSFGRYLYAIGGGEDISKMHGINVDHFKWLAFAVAGVFFGLGGVLNVSKLGQGTVEVGSYLFPTVAAVVVGGTSIAGGSGGVLQGVVGVLFMTSLANGMILMGLHPFAQIALQGVFILMAVILTLDRSKIPTLK